MVGAGLLLSPAAMAERVSAPIERLRSEAVIGELTKGGMPPERLAEFKEQVGAITQALGVVYPAVFVIAGGRAGGRERGAAAPLPAAPRPGWLEDGEFERVRFPLAAGRGLRAGGRWRSSCRWRGRPAYNVLLVLAFFFALQGLAVVAFYAHRLAGPPLLRAAWWCWCSLNPWAPQILALLGLFDNWIDFRKWAEPPPGREDRRAAA